MKNKLGRFVSCMLAVAMLLSLASVGVLAADETYTVTYNESDKFYVVTNPNGGTTLSVADKGILIEAKDGGFTYAFKDLNGNGKLDKYEDWRLTAEARAQDLVSQMNIEQITALMMCTWHMSGLSGDLDAASSMQGVSSSTLMERGIRFYLNGDSGASVEDQVAWQNAMQKVAEADADMLGIPIQVYSDPRSSVNASTTSYDGALDGTSEWPMDAGMGATFDPSLVEGQGQMVAQEYRALGIHTALSPQIDVLTEPRWNRANQIYTESPQLMGDIAAAYTRGFQSTYVDGKSVWGSDSVGVMLKHWPGDGLGEGGRESHAFSGKYAVYPGDNLTDHLIPFAASIQNVTGTSLAAAIMPSYSVGIGSDGKPLGTDSAQVGSGGSNYKMNEVLRGTYAFDGVVCSDWGAAGNFAETDDGLTAVGGGTAWGLEDMMNQGDYEFVWGGYKNGLDQYGGLDYSEAALNAYEYAVGEIGEKAALERFEQSGYRLVLSSLRLGLFDNAFLNTAESKATVGNAEFVEAGYQAQLKSIVMLKNEGNLINANNAKKTVYMPLLYTAPAPQMFGPPSAATIAMSVNETFAKQYFNVVTDEIRAGADPAAYTEADIVRRTDFTGVDFAFIKVTSPQNQGNYFGGAGFDMNARSVPGDVMIPNALGAPSQNPYQEGKPLDNGFFPRSLQYSPYTADPEVVRMPLGLDADEEARWIAAGGEPGKSRYYGGESTTMVNEAVLGQILTVAKCGLPLVLDVRTSSPFIPAEFELYCDAILLDFGSSDLAILDVVSGQVEPTGLLPYQMPANMTTVEKQYEDVPFDMECYVDAAGHTYDFAYGMNWKGVIKDSRTAKYARANSPSFWAVAQVTAAKNHGLVVSSATSNYTAQMTCATLAEMASNVVKAAGKSADQAALLSGTGLSANDALTRESAAIILTKAMSILGYTTTGAAQTQFKDQSSISSAASSAVNYIVSTGIMQGTGYDGTNKGTASYTFSPKQVFTNEMGIITVERMYQYTVSN